MKFILFNKCLQTLNVDALIDLACCSGFDGLDLCCREGYPLTLENFKNELPKLAAKVKAAQLTISLVTAPGDFVKASDEKIEPILATMQQEGIPFLKIGYFHIDNQREDYWEKVKDTREELEAWSKLGERYGVKICYHTHSGAHYMGLNAAAVMHLLKDLDPRHIGVYLDPGHLFIDGERPDIAFNMVKKYLMVVALKDMMKVRSFIGYSLKVIVCRGGFGQVNWPSVFDNLLRLDFDGPLSLHGEYAQHYSRNGNGESPEYLASLKEECGFFRQMLKEAKERNLQGQN